MTIVPSGEWRLGTNETKLMYLVSPSSVNE